ncbi:hypothetical protein [Corynebacterium sp. J010B-136]|uniref:hypothetical protein n=1 Tax=Corynebacterium sp. J010B-136 TaxID=2099401 RepID=UPI000CFA56E3|nr:hypothetical protein [Corynebacterium sp. J010B-136]PQM74010.1 hypothetical protein C5Y44_09200 [Corynebacterium sp. J010B-136]
MKIHHKTGFALGVAAIVCALGTLAAAIAGEISTITVVLALSTTVIGALIIHWSTSEKHRERCNPDSDLG